MVKLSQKEYAAAMVRHMRQLKETYGDMANQEWNVRNNVRNSRAGTVTRLNIDGTTYYHVMGFPAYSRLATLQAQITRQGY